MMNWLRFSNPSRNPLPSDLEARIATMRHDEYLTVNSEESDPEDRVTVHKSYESWTVRLGSGGVSLAHSPRRAVVYAKDRLAMLRSNRRERQGNPYGLLPSWYRRPTYVVLEGNRAIPADEWTGGWVVLQRRPEGGATTLFEGKTIGEVEEYVRRLSRFPSAGASQRLRG